VVATLGRSLNGRVASRLAWSPFFFLLGCTVSVWVASGHPELSGAFGCEADRFSLVHVHLGFPAVGAVIVSRRPGNRVGWILCAIGGSPGLAVASDLVGRAAVLG
jgi:hypothetical protein